MVELFDADLKRKGFDGVALPAGSYELHKINGVRLDINKSLDELGVQDGDTLVLVPRVAGESFEPQYESLSTGLAAMGKWLGRDGGDRMFAPVTSLTAAHTAMAIIAMAVGVVLALTLRTRTITDSPVPAAMAGGIGVLLVIGALVVWWGWRERRDLFSGFGWLTAAMTSLALGALAGLVLALLSAPWLIAVGAICIAGAWLYTGGSKPYGYAGFGELAVFVFFGPVAVLGTQYTQALRVDWVGLAQAVATGALSCSVLVANNLRDIPTDARADKITLAVRLGDARTRMLYQGLLAVAGVLTFVLMLATPWCVVGLVAAPLALRAAGPVRSGRGGRELIPVLRDTGLAMLVWALAVAGALAFGQLS